MSEDWLKLEDKYAATEAIRRLREEDLLFLDSLIHERLKLMAQVRSTILMSQFSIGDEVWFDSRDGRRITGVVSKLNKRNTQVLAGDGHIWTVYPGFLQRLKTSESDGQEKA
jgi:hypothetical protein